MKSVHIRRGVVALLFALVWLAAPASGAETAEKRTGWAALSRVEPGTAIVVHLTDGRRLDRVMVDTTADALNTVDLSLVSSRDRRAEILRLVRKSPQRYAGPVLVAQDGTRIQNRATYRPDHDRRGLEAGVCGVHPSDTGRLAAALCGPVPELRHRADGAHRPDAAPLSASAEGRRRPRAGRGALPGAGGSIPQPAGRATLGAASAALAPVASREVTCRAVAAP